MVVFSSCRKPNHNNISSNNENNNPLDSLYFFDSDSGIFDYAFYSPLSNKPFKVHYYIPNNVNRTTAPILFVFPGANRNADDYLNTWISIADIKGLKGLIINHRTSFDVMTNFFKPDAECFSNRGIKRREKFYDCWDTIIEYWFLNYENFFKGRFDKKLLTNINNFEDKYFEKSFYREVDETVAVMPKRNISTDFYHR